MKTQSVLLNWWTTGECNYKQVQFSATKVGTDEVHTFQGIYLEISPHVWQLVPSTLIDCGVKRGGDSI